MLSVTRIKILLEMYKKAGDLNRNYNLSINPESLGISHEEFVIALEELDKEGLMEGVAYKCYGGKGNKPQLVDLGNASLTQKGINEVEKIMQV